jgi:hypothetical protein
MLVSLQGPEDVSTWGKNGKKKLSGGREKWSYVDSGLFQPIFRQEAETKKSFVTVYRGFELKFLLFLGNLRK